MKVALPLLIAGFSVPVSHLLAATPRSAFRFAWPEGMKAKVTYSREIKRVLESGSKRSSSQFTTFEIQVGRRADAFVIQRTLAAFPSEQAAGPFWQKVDGEGKPVPNFDEIQDLVDEVTDRIPTMVVGPEGEFLGTEDTEPIREELERRLKRSGLPAETQAKVRILFGEAGLAALAKEQWSLWVGLWKGRALARGRPFTEQRRGVFPNTSYVIDLLVEGSFEGSVPCGPSDRARSCVELRLVSRPDPAQVTRTIEQLNLSKTAGIRSLSLEQAFTVVTRPQTLQPHRCHRTMSAEIEHAPGSPAAMRSEHLTQTWEFDYSSDEGRVAP